MSRVALVTGGASGIGRASAIALARLDYVVAVNYRTRLEQAKATVADIQAAGGEAIAVQADVSRVDHVDRCFGEVEESLGPVTILVNNAGTRRDKLAISMTDEDWDEVIRTNLFGTMACIRRGLRSMLSQRWGRIVNVSSAIALRGNPGQVNYAASKAGVIGMTKSLAREIGSRGITVNAVAPGLVPTDLTTNLSDDQFAELQKEIPIGRAGTAEEVGAVVAFLCSEAASYVTGTVVVVDGGMTA